MMIKPQICRPIGLKFEKLLSRRSIKFDIEIIFVIFFIIRNLAAGEPGPLQSSNQIGVV